MRDSTARLLAATRLRELLCTSVVGDLLHDLGDVDALDLALKLTQRLGELARAAGEVNHG